ncbi:MAG: DUF1491 family protein [Pseudomonadota bacterium]
MTARVKTGIWVAAYVRRCAASGAAAFIAAKGDPDAGAVLVKIATLDGQARLLLPSRDLEGRSVWRTAKAGAETDVDAYAARERQIDSDLWIVEVEDKDGRHFLTEPVEDDI